MSEAVDFQQVDLRFASDHEYECLSTFNNILNHEYFPDDPPTPLEEFVQDWKNIPALIEHQAYLGWDLTRTQIIAFGVIFIRHTGDNQHVAQFRVEVLPDFRRQGLGRHTLKLLLAFAKEHKRTLLLAWTNDRVSAATLFLERMGARRGLEGRVNQLKVSELDWELIQRWSKQSEHLGSEFDMGLWEEVFPEDRMEEIAALMQKLANDQPRDNLELEDEKITPDFIRQIQQNMLAAGEKIWTLYIVDPKNQKLVGWTQVYWNPNRPMILNQGFTAVDNTYRNKGLGRSLKAEMMKKILEEKPQVEFIRTRNANSNAPMLKINNEMGFKPYNSITAWQVNTDQVESYLKEKGLL
jgi:GNAT superfamily N-acetyltransferase